MVSPAPDADAVVLDDPEVAIERFRNQVRQQSLKDLHQADLGIGTMRSCASSAAYAIAACTSSTDNVGYSATILSALMPAARLSRMTETEMRVPRIHTFPWQSFGSEDNRSLQVTISSAPVLH